MHNKILSSILVSFFTFSSMLLAAQNKVSLTDLDIEVNANKWYDNQVGLENTVLHIGNLYNDARKASRSHPYFNSPYWGYGTIVYQNQQFDSVALIYDIESDIVVTQNKLGNDYLLQPIQLNKDQIISFTVHGALFEPVEQRDQLFQSGFHQILYRGENLEVIVRHKKLVEMEGNRKTAYFGYKDYYFKTSEAIRKIKNNSTIKNLYPEHKKEIKTFLRANNINISKEEDLNLIMLAEFCNDLNL